MREKRLFKSFTLRCCQFFPFWRESALGNAPILSGNVLWTFSKITRFAENCIVTWFPTQLKKNLHPPKLCRKLVLRLGNQTAAAPNDCTCWFNAAAPFFGLLARCTSKGRSSCSSCCQLRWIWNVTTSIRTNLVKFKCGVRRANVHHELRNKNNSWCEFRGPPVPCPLILAIPAQH